MTGLFLTALLASQLAQADFTAIQERKTHIFILLDGTELPVYYEKKENGYTVEVDVPPWTDRRFFAMSQVKSIQPERKVERYRRIRQWYEAHGYTEVAKWAFWPAAEVEWARKALVMAKESGVGMSPPDVNSVTPPKEGGGAPFGPVVRDKRPGPMAQWGAQMALGVVALLVVGLVARTLVFPSE